MSKRVYAIETQSEQYYVGSTKWPKYRIRDHFNGDGAKFLQENEPRRVVLVTEEREDWKEVEKAVTLWFADMAGRRNVRGYSWTATKPAPVVRYETGYPKYPSKSTIENLNTEKLPDNLPLYLFL